MSSFAPRGPRQVGAAFVWSMKGIGAAFVHESSFRLEAYVAVIVIPLGLWLGHGGVEKLLLAGTPLLVLAAELVNSAIEALVDLVSPGFNELAGRAKDIGSAVAFLMMVLVFLTWVLVLGGHVWW